MTFQPTACSLQPRMLCNCSQPLEEGSLLIFFATEDTYPQQPRERYAKSQVCLQVFPLHLLLEGKRKIKNRSLCKTFSLPLPLCFRRLQTFCNCSGFVGQGIFLMLVTLVDCSVGWLAVVFLCLSTSFEGGSRAGYGVNHVDIAPKLAFPLSFCFECMRKRAFSARYRRTL